MNLLGRTLSDQFALVWARDPALDVDRLDAEHAEDPTKPNFADAYKRACETQDWSPLLKPGEKATVFRFRLLTGRIGDRVKDMARSGEAGPNEVLGIAFRVALVSIDGWGSPLPKFSRVKDAEYTHLDVGYQRAELNKLKLEEPAEVSGEKAGPGVSAPGPQAKSKLSYRNEEE